MRAKPSSAPQDTIELVTTESIRAFPVPMASFANMLGSAWYSHCKFAVRCVRGRFSFLLAGFPALRGPVWTTADDALPFLSCIRPIALAEGSNHT